MDIAVLHIRATQLPEYVFKDARRPQKKKKGETKTNTGPVNPASSVTATGQIICSFSTISATAPPPTNTSAAAAAGSGPSASPPGSAALTVSQAPSISPPSVPGSSPTPMQMSVSLTPALKSAGSLVAGSGGATPTANGDSAAALNGTSTTAARGGASPTPMQTAATNGAANNKRSSSALTAIDENGGGAAANGSAADNNKRLKPNPTDPNGGGQVLTAGHTLPNSATTPGIAVPPPTKQPATVVFAVNTTVAKPLPTISVQLKRPPSNSAAAAPAPKR